MGGDLAKPRSDAQNVDPETTMIPIQRSWAGITAGWMAAGVLSLAFTAAAGEDWWIDPAFTKVLHRSIKRFAGKAEGDYFVPQALVADEIKEGLGGPPEPAVEESGGIRLIAALSQCRRAGGGVVEQPAAGGSGGADSFRLC